MKLDRKDMLEIMDEIDGRYVDEAGKTEKLERKSGKCRLIVGNIIKYGFIAACLAAVIGAATLRVLKYQESDLQSGSKMLPTDDGLSGEPVSVEFDGEQIEETTVSKTAGAMPEATVLSETSAEAVSETEAKLPSVEATAAVTTAAPEKDGMEANESSTVVWEGDERD